MLYRFTIILVSSVQSLRGPRGGMIFFKKDPVLGVDLESSINNAVFPGLQVSSFSFLFILLFFLHKICSLIANTLPKIRTSSLFGLYII